MKAPFNNKPSIWATKVTFIFVTLMTITKVFFFRCKSRGHHVHRLLRCRSDHFHFTGRRSCKEQTSAFGSIRCFICYRNDSVGRYGHCVFSADYWTFSASHSCLHSHCLSSPPNLLLPRNYRSLQTTKGWKPIGEETKFWSQSVACRCVRHVVQGKICGL